ncbi:LysM domain-containing protein [Fusarium keratoplasticum]|uniref:LysM domain-containing protein n=1 Tax=Fusarium keratoplasticum TaxID=1328300 RepID=A0ACC0QJY2_9HYPO|nr:LysM domain-containing protein [Fusarium keratoplasticum]KAI8657422.1 LysM domain-containing protein [Fusarium keratoplasticum]KAI8658389.1 LysM domain-containing protein [Fusarium keratoplasticum]
MEFAESILWAQDIFCLEDELHSTPGSRLVTNTQHACEGTIYTVQKGDTCQFISKAMSVATDRLIERNGLTYTCSDLLEGRNLCIEDACEIARIEQGQTCQDFVKWKWFSTIQLQSWNPTLKPLCNSRLIPNLDAVAGRYICIGPPGDFNSPEPSPTRPVKGKWRIEAPVSTKPSKTIMNSTPVTTTEPLEPYKTHLSKIDASPEAANSKAECLKYCWLTNETWDYTLDTDGPPEDCQSLMDIYCTFPERPSPTAPSSIPETCTPGSDVDEL